MRVIDKTTRSIQGNSGSDFVKRANDGSGCQQLRHEAEILAAARHPGVVELIRLDDEGGRVNLILGRIDGHDLTSHPPLSVEEAAGVLAGVASTLADLHDLGIVHGAIAPEHVLVATDGRAVLCGLRHGGRTGQLPMAPAVIPEGFADPVRLPADPLLPETDVFGVGALITWVLQAGAPSKPSRALLKLRAVAARATTAEVQRRPPARDLAAAITAAVPNSRLPDGAWGHTAAAPPPRRAGPVRAGSLGRLRARSHTGPRARAARSERGTRARAALVAGATLAGVVLLLGAAQMLESARRTQPSPVEDGETEPAAPAVATTRARPAPLAESEPRRAPVPPVDPRCPEITAPLSADLDGDGCAEPLRWAGGVIEGGSARWAVGQAGDQVATADWGCTGLSTLALLRPTTGEVFLFDRWAAPGRDLVAGVAARVEGAVALRRAELDGDRCPELVVERRDGAAATVPRP